MDQWNTIAERKIREAMAEGAFDNLNGKGRPLGLEENPYEDPSLRMGHRLLRNNGFAPAWIEEPRTWNARLSRCGRTWFGSIRTIPDAIRKRVTEINRRILEHNLKTPA